MINAVEFGGFDHMSEGDRRMEFGHQFQVDMEHDAVEFGRSLRADDEVVLEATGNTATIVRLLTPFVARVVIANPLQVKAIAHARVKTDKVDAKILAQLHGRVPA